MVPIDLYPITLMLLQLGPPTTIDPTQRNGVLGVTNYVFRHNANKLAKHFGITGYATSSLDTWSLIRVIAKVGHSFAVAELGLDGFNPLLKETIIRINRLPDFSFVGGTPDRFPKTEHTHEVVFVG